MRLTEGADGTTDALVYGFLMSVCDPGSGALHTVDDAGIRDRLAGSGLIDSAGRPTEQAYDLYRSIPVRHLGTVGIGDAFLTAVRMIGYDDGEEHDSFVTGSGLIVANVLDGTVEIIGTDDTDVACTIGRMIGKKGAEEGDLVLSALADEPSESYKLAVSVALKAVQALE